MNWSWIKRRWFEFRNGHGTYLSFFLSFTNFLLITYNLLIDRVSFLCGLFSNVAVFAVVGILIYVPLAIVVGRLHNKKQLSTDMEVVSRANPVSMDIVERLKRIEKRLS